jgi:hypothetical protein
LFLSYICINASNLIKQIFIFLKSLRQRFKPNKIQVFLINKFLNKLHEHSKKDLLVHIQYKLGFKK